MKTLRLLAVTLLVALAACTWRVDPNKQAREFFDEGKDTILAALKKQDATEAQLKAAEAVLAQHENTVMPEIAAVLRNQHKLFRGIVSGQNSATLVALEAELHTSNEQAVRDIGRMHEALSASVGEPTWKAATADLDRRWARHFRE